MTKCVLSSPVIWRDDNTSFVILLVTTTHPSSYHLWRQHILRHITGDDNTSFVILRDDNTHFVILLLMTTHPSSYYLWWQHILRHITYDNNTSFVILLGTTTHPSSYYVWWQHILRHITCDDNTSFVILREGCVVVTSNMTKDVLSSQGKWRRMGCRHK